MTVIAAFGRALVVVFWLATSAYAFLASVPFVYEQFLQPGLVPALAHFVRWHGALAVAATALAAVALWPDLSRRRALGRVTTYLWGHTLVAVAIVVAAPLSVLEPGGMAVAAAAGALLPVLGLAGLDLSLAPWPDQDRASDLAGRDAAVAGAAALACGTAFALTGLAAAGRLDGHGVALSAAAHGLLFAVVFLLFALVRAVGDLTSKPAQWEATAAAGLMSALVGLSLAFVIPPALAVRDLGTRGTTFLFGATIGLTLAARGTRHAVPVERDGIAQVLSGVVPAWARLSSWRVRAVWALCVLTLVLAGPVFAGAMDWNFVVAKLGATAVWLLVLATAAAWMPRGVRLPGPAPYAACASVLALYLVVSGRVAFAPVTLEAAITTGDAWAVGDPSFRTIRDWLHRPTPGAAAVPGGGLGFFDFLAAHTNIARSIDVAPVPVTLADLASPATPISGRPPHVFVFVIDSLRRDYLSPYNPAVTFTPALERFAQDSTVFTHAFTRYGATGLSVPSIWVGGMLVHKQYVTPFAPMNALHGLLDRHQYARWMSMDNIVDVIMPRGPSLDPIDRDRGVADFRFCTSLDDLRGRLDPLAAGAPPTFVWSLPQDIHVAVLNREGARSVDGGRYDGFFAPYASRVRRLDECFGRFVDELKARRLYDDSLIIVTADHGDSLGEEGRWGHAFTIYPEVVQVPLVVHLPVSARARLDTQPEALAFTTDITPTLYTLLGHTVTADAPIFGRSLVWPKGGAPPARPPFGLVASSYGSVYGWLDEAGTELYVADGVALRDYVFELNGTAAGVAKPVTAAARVEGQRRIRDGVQAIADFYRFTPPTP